ncbi:MAG: hypothetical protein JWN70_275 [Planctomycetaceae bacterium]|nr:hypothetical protein [Planctomycetaceae bacterium]
MTQSKPTISFPIESDSLLHRMLVLLARRVSETMQSSVSPDASMCANRTSTCDNERQSIGDVG